MSVAKASSCQSVNGGSGGLTNVSIYAANLLASVAKTSQDEIMDNKQPYININKGVLMLLRDSPIK